MSQSERSHRSRFSFSAGDEAKDVHEPLLDVDFLFDELEELHLVLGPESIVIQNVRETVVVCFRGLIATREEELGLLVKIELKGLI